MQVQVIEPKRGRDVGRILVQMHLENVDDLALVHRGMLTPNDVRSLDVEALVDTGATYICLTAADIARLGLHPVRKRRARTAAGLVTQQIYSAVRVTVEGRDCLSEVAELPEGSPALLGQIPLELMDFWIHVPNQRLTGNPEHGGQWMIDMF